MKWKSQLKQVSAFAFSIILSTLANGQNSACWQKNATIDGKIDEWHGNLRSYDKNSRIKYDFANDEKFLYLAFEAIETPTQINLMMNGMDIRLKTKMKPKITATFHLNGKSLERPEFPHEPGEGNSQRQFDPTTRQSDKHQMPSIEPIKQSYLISKPTIETEGLIARKEPITAGDNGEIAFQIRWNEANQMILEMRVPLTQLFGTNYDLSKIIEKEIALFVNLNTPQMPEMTHGDMPQGRPAEGMGPGGPMGGMSPDGLMMGNQGKLFFKNNILITNQQ